MRAALLAFAVALSAVCLSGEASAATPSETLIVGLPEPGRVPFFWIDDAGAFQGSYIVLLRKIGAMIGVRMDFVMMPQSRLIAGFNAGRLDLEPGIAPSWRPSKEEKAISIYSAPFMEMEDVLVFRQGISSSGIAKGVDLPTRLKGLKVGQVRGFFVPPGLEVMDAMSEEQIAKLIQSGKLDAGLMNRQVAAWYKGKLHYDFSISASFASTPVSFRLRAEKLDLLAPIDKALAELQRRGELERILHGAVDQSGS